MGKISFGRATISGCCKDCTERYEACHDQCLKYQAALAEWRDYNERIRQAKMPSEYDQYRFKSIGEMKKRRGWHERKS